VTDPGKQRESQLRLVRAYAQLVVVMRDALARLGRQEAFRTTAARRAMQHVFEEALEREDLLVALARLPRGPDAIAQRLAAVAAFCLVMTRRLLLSPRDSVDLCVAALFHDFSRLPGEPLPPSAFGVRSVVRASADVLTDEVMHQSAIAVEWAAPARDASATARFLAVPSLFELLSQPGPGRPAIAVNDVMGVLGQLGGTRLDENVVRLFTHTLGFYPPGTVVLLSDGSHAVVKRPPPEEHPLDQPLVRRFDARAFAAVETQLGREPGLVIKGAVSPTLNPLRAWFE
jgi:hypothetical protein